MQLLSSQVSGYLERASWIRKMFEEGARLKAEFGADKVYDFSLGNPDLPPPAAVGKGLADLAKAADKPFALGYMPNAGYDDARARLAEHLSREQGCALGAGDLILTCGAAGGLNAFFRAVLEPGEEVLAPAPFFVEYGFYTENHGGVFKTVRAKELTFDLDLDAMAAAIGPKTRVVLVNSPNNPTGAVYSAEQMAGLVEMLRRKTEEYGRPVFLAADEPYRFLAFDGAQVPTLLPMYEYAVVVSSFSKNLSLAGERLGFVAVAPQMPDKGRLMAGLVLTNRILGFVNAPAVGQKLMAAALGSQVDVGVYAARRKAMAEVLDAAGYEYSMPKGAFYFFPKAPGGDDIAFVNRLKEQRVLAVPGTGFGFPGYFRLTFCVDEKVIRAAADGFRKAAEI
ncbi:MAG: pyridoxal phosphate-dependent aminotransferase [Thermodesulfobacteriota bacterium]